MYITGIFKFPINVRTSAIHSRETFYIFFYPVSKEIFVSNNVIFLLWNDEWQALKLTRLETHDKVSFLSLSSFLLEFSTVIFPVIKQHGGYIYFKYFVTENFTLKFHQFFSKIDIRRIFTLERILNARNIFPAKYFLKQCRDQSVNLSRQINFYYNIFIALENNYRNAWRKREKGWLLVQLA